MNSLFINGDFYSRASRYQVEDDLVDRLNNRVTIHFLMMCFAVITGTMYVGKPINCWTPAEFKGQHDTYTNSICWLKGSYYLPTDEITIPDRTKPREYFVSYYQWTPFILIGMAALFLFPRLVWHSFLRQGGINISQMISTIRGEKPPKDFPKYIRDTFGAYLDAQADISGAICGGCRCKNFTTSYTMTYLGTKVLYIINTISQFFLLNLFLSFNFTGFGVAVIQKTLSGEDWFESPRFPRVTMCDFMVRRLGSNQHWYATQCTLPINMYNEKIFLLVWIWLIVLTIFNIISLITWIFSLTSGRQKAVISKYLDLSNVLTDRTSAQSNSTNERPVTTESVRDQKNLERLSKYLGTDGFLIFELIARNTDDIEAARIIRILSEYANESFVPIQQR